jgi:hypothetical protein
MLQYLPEAVSGYPTRHKTQEQWAGLMPNGYESARSGVLRWRLALVFAVYVFAFGGHRGFGEDPSSIQSKFVRTNFTIEEGLPDNTVDAIAETDKRIVVGGYGVRPGVLRRADVYTGAASNTRSSAASLQHFACGGT